MKKVIISVLFVLSGYLFAVPLGMMQFSVGGNFETGSPSADYTITLISGHTMVEDFVFINFNAVGYSTSSGVLLLPTEMAFNLLFDDKMILGPYARGCVTLHESSSGYLWELGIKLGGLSQIFNNSAHASMYLGYNSRKEILFSVNGDNFLILLGIAAGLL